LQRHRRSQRQCQRGQTPSRSFYSAVVVDNVDVSVIVYRQRDRFPSRSFYSAIVVVSVNVSVMKFRLAAFTAPSSSIS
jgi:ethanolamine utilization protein EutP (predicted NTPase)